MKKVIICMICLARIFPNIATIDDTMGFYKANNPNFSYLNFGSSYYLNVADDFHWTGKSWIFKTGYRFPANKCGGSPRIFRGRLYNHSCK